MMEISVLWHLSSVFDTFPLIIKLLLWAQHVNLKKKQFDSWHSFKFYYCTHYNYKIDKTYIKLKSFKYLAARSDI